MLDLQLLTSVYEALREDDAFAAMAEAWTVRFDALRGEFGEVDDDPILSREIERIARLVDNDLEAGTADPLQRAVEEIPSAAMILTTTGRVVMMNRAAEARFDLARGASLPDAAIDTAYLDEYRTMLRSAREAGNRNHAIVRLAGTHDSDRRPLAEISLLPLASADEAFVSLRMLDLPWSDQVRAAIAESFNLTDAEIDVTRRFFETRDAGAVAAQRGASPETVRSQLKAILAKTDCHSRAELVDLVTLTAARMAVATKSELAHWRDPLLREKVITRPNGKKLAYTWMGAKDGVPALYSPGHSLTFLLPGPADAEFREAGIKLYLISRPGCGQSEADMELGALDDQVNALADLVDHLDIRGAPAIGCQNGVLALMALAARRTGLISQIVTSGLFWSKHNGASRKLGRKAYGIMNLASRSPILLDLFIRIALRNIRKNGVQWYVEQSGKELPIDAATLAHTQHMPLIRHAVAHMVFQGNDAVRREFQIVNENWRKLAQDIAIPVHMILPQFDPMQDVADFAERLPGAFTHEIVADTGTLALYQKSQAIAKRIVAMVRRHDGAAAKPDKL